MRLNKNVAVVLLALLVVLVSVLFIAGSRKSATIRIEEVGQFDNAPIFSAAARTGQSIPCVKNCDATTAFLAAGGTKLYGQTADRVYQYEGGTEWTVIPRGLGASSITSMIVDDSGLPYIGTNVSQIFELNARGAAWMKLGDQLGRYNDTRVLSLAVYDGKLYAGTFNPSRVYRYDGGLYWTDVSGPLSFALEGGVNSLVVYAGKLYAGAGILDPAKVYRYDGNANWTDIGQLGDKNGISYLVVYGGKLYAGTAGSVYQYDGNTWSAVSLQNDDGILSLVIYNGRLYGGASPSSKLYRYENGTTWTEVAKLGVDDGYLWAIWSLASHDGKLYAVVEKSSAGIRGSSKVYAISNMPN